MDKQEFLALLENGLAGLPEEDVAGRVAFYSEMIDDRIEEGLSEKDAVAEMGPMEAILAQTLSEIPLPKLVRERVKPKHQMRAWEIILLVLGSPLWLSLMLAFGAVILSVYVVLWSLVLSLWAVELAVALSAFAVTLAGIVLLFRSGIPQGMLLIGAGIFLAGLAILLFYGVKAGTRGAAVITSKIAVGIKLLFIRREN